MAPQQVLQALQMLDVRLQQLERGAQATQMAVAKSDGGLDRVSQQLQAEKIVIPDDAIAFQGQTVAGPFTAFVQADIIQHHALEASGGKTYAELDREDPVRATMMNASFLRTSLFTSIVSFGVAAFVAGVGALFILFGWALTRLAPRGTVHSEP